MRNGNNKRMRGRSRGGKGPNPLSRSYESNGPDVKIRGTAQHIAEKYLQLARDAHSSGDPVSAENYLQHAEHYFRLIAAAQEALRQPPAFRADGQPMTEDEADEGDDEDDFASMFDKRFESPVVVRPEQPQQQPRSDFGGGQRDFQGQPREYQNDRGDRPDRGERRDFQGERGERRDFQGQNRDRQDRDRFPNPNGPRFQDRDRDRDRDRPRFQPDQAGGEQPEIGAEGEGGQPRDGRPYESRRERFERRRAERFAERQARREGEGEMSGGDQPAPAPQPRSEEASIGLPAFITGGGAPSVAAVEDAEAPAAAKPRRRRTPRISEDEVASSGE